MKKAAVFFSLLFCFVSLHSMDIRRQEDLLRDFLWEEFTQHPADKKPGIGVVLSAGGARGFSHVGVLEALSNARVPIDYMSGTSMGAVVGSFYAAGVPFPEMWDIGGNVTLDKVSSDFSVKGVLGFFLFNRLPSSKNFEDFINEKIGAKKFEDLNIPFACVAMDARTGERVPFTSGPVGIAVRASMNLPGVFKPVEYKQRLLVDGGVVDYLPISIIKDMGAQYVIAVTPKQDLNAKLPQSTAEYFVQTGDIRGAMILEERLKQADFVISPVISGVGVLDTSKLITSGEMGLRKTYKMLGELKESILIFANENAK